MNTAEAAATLAYAVQIDGRIQATEANTDVWGYGLAGIPLDQIKWIIRDYYARADDSRGGLQPITPGYIRSRARAENERAAAKRAALESKPVKTYEQSVDSWRARNPAEWDRLVREGVHEQWEKWRRQGEANRPCACGCGKAAS